MKFLEFRFGFNYAVVQSSCLQRRGQEKQISLRFFALICSEDFFRIHSYPIDISGLFGKKPLHLNRFVKSNLFWRNC